MCCTPRTTDNQSAKSAKQSDALQISRITAQSQDNCHFDVFHNFDFKMAQTDLMQICIKLDKVCNA